MNNKNLVIVAGALIVGGFIGYLAASSGAPSSTEKVVRKDSSIPAGMHRMPDGTLMGSSNGSMGMGMMGGMGMMMVSSEKEFLTEMIPHHQEAVDTAKQVLARGATTPEIRTLMENIVKAQEKEIGDMKAWYEEWYGQPYRPSNAYQPMMRDLSKLNGVELDKAFLEDMVMHHMGAIMMAHSVQGAIEHEEVRNLTKAIVTTQSEEIALMRKLRAALK